jgi:hypothetical protein
MQIDGARVEHATVLSRYGFFAFEPEGNAWRVTFRDVHGATRAHCVLKNKSLACR